MTTDKYKSTNVMTIEFSDLNKLPDEKSLVLIKYRSKDPEREDHNIFFIGTGYVYRGEFWVGFHSPISFPKVFEVLGWAHYDKLI
jgi:hypothetical protein